MPILMRRLSIMTVQINTSKTNFIMKTNIPVKDKRSLKMVRNIVAILFKDNVMDMALVSSQMEACIKETGKLAK